ncbi:MAG: sigma-54-dependent Fis family transcriptional regulator, partial [Sphaerochaetaceae bacterium]|nr:sigma-54-dependent Fis family transcriptional regulator [Sphaerochaetaceae bacterium]
KSQRSKEPFVIVDCSAIPESLIESVLFGYEKGSFTGADVQRIGRIEESQGGTLFLDEVGELPLSSQAKFLRVIQEHQFVRVGGSAQVKVDFRVLAATNKNLKEEVDAGRFRSDLFYRLNVIRIDSPPLRDRKDDIPVLCEFFMQQSCKENSLPYREISREELSKMMAYQWPGNVRELRNCIQRLCILDSLSQEIEASAPQETSPSQSTKLSDQEKELVQQALELMNWNISRAAQHLGIGRKALYNRIAKYQISVPDRTL